MRKIAILGALGAFLAGCAGVYDQGAVPAATAARQLAVERCATVQGNSQIAECLIAAERQFALAVKLKQPALQEAYEARMRLAVADREAGRIDGKQLGERAAAITQDYYAQIEQTAAIDFQRRQAIAAALAGIGAAAERQADRDAYIQAHNRPLNCTSTKFGSTVTTNCN